MRQTQKVVNIGCRRIEQQPQFLFPYSLFIKSGPAACLSGLCSEHRADFR